MTKSIRVNEYYDLFNVAYITGLENTDLPRYIRDTEQTNPFHGFSNWKNAYDLEANGANDADGNRVLKGDIPITGKKKSFQASNTLHIDDNGDIWCYPPNVSVPYWTKVIFRNFDYNINTQANPYDSVLSYQEEIALVLNEDGDTIDIGLDGNLKDSNQDVIYTFDDAGLTFDDPIKISGYQTKWNKGNVFLKCDEYPSRSKVIFSGVDRTRNPDIELAFNYHKGQMEPIKLNISLSAGIPFNDVESVLKTRWNQNLDKDDLTQVFDSCYWCIEWICDKDAGN